MFTFDAPYVLLQLAIGSDVFSIGYASFFNDLSLPANSLPALNIARKTLFKKGR